MIPVPTSNHNEALSGDTLYSAFLNYEWREIVVAAIVERMAQIAATIDDESDRQDFEVRYGALIDDLYNEDFVDSTPVGVISAFVGEIADIPAKWLLCDGSTHNNADYPELAAIMPGIWDGSTQFVVPDFKLKFIRGTGNDAGIGSTGGATTHTLTVAELPAHHHIVPAHAHNVPARANAGSTSNVAALAGAATNANIATDTEPATDTSDTGGGTAFETQPPFVSVHWIIKALP